MRDELPRRTPGAQIPSHSGQPCPRCMGYAKSRAEHSGRDIAQEYPQVQADCGCPVRVARTSPAVLLRRDLARAVRR